MLKIVLLTFRKALNYNTDINKEEYNLTQHSVTENCQLVFVRSGNPNISLSHLNFYLNNKLRRL